MAVEEIAEELAGAKVRLAFRRRRAAREFGFLGQPAEKILLKRLTARIMDAHRPHYRSTRKTRVIARAYAIFGNPLS